MKISKLSPYLGYALALSAFLFALYFSLSYKINFMQNDDSYYHATMDNFLSGNFTLQPKVAPTFYVQGIAATLFILIFGPAHLPILTLAVSCLNIALLFLLLTQKLRVGVATSVLLCLMVFFNPLYQYSILGFMSENYLIPFLLLSLYFFYSYLESGRAKSLIASTVLWIIGFFARQVILVLPIAYSIKLFLEKKYKAAVSQFLALAGVVLFYQFVFPQSDEMRKKSLQLAHFLETNYAFALAYGILLYMAAFLLPVFLLSIYGKLKTFSFKKIVFWALLSIGLFIALNRAYQPMSVSWGEFPFFENVFERTGFLARSISGTKYYFRGNFVLYKYWELASKIVIALFLSSLVIGVKKVRFFNNLNVLVTLIYISLMVAVYTFYDRYLVFLLIPFLLAMLKQPEILKSQLARFVLIPFVIFIAYFSYVLSKDFVLINSYVWERAEKLVANGVQENRIFASSAWNRKAVSKYEIPVYFFSYDSTRVNPELKQEYVLIDQYCADFPGNLFLNPKVYLYQRR